MKAIRKFPMCGKILVLLLLANLGWMSWNVYQNGHISTAGKRFKIEVLHTNDMSGTGIIEAKTGNPVWIEWDYTNNSRDFSYFYHGTNIFNLSDFKGKPLLYSVGFHGPGKSSVWWWDIGRGTFIERNFSIPTAIFPNSRFGITTLGTRVLSKTERWALSSMGVGVNFHYTRTLCRR